MQGKVSTSFLEYSLLKGYFRFSPYFPCMQHDGYCLVRYEHHRHPDDCYIRDTLKLRYSKGEIEDAAQNHMRGRS